MFEAVKIKKIKYMIDGGLIDEQKNGRYYNIHYRSMDMDN